MQFILGSVLLFIFVSEIKTEAEPLSGTLSGPLAGSGPGAYKDAHHEFIQAFHHGQHHSGVNGGSEGGSSAGAVGHAVLNAQIQDQSSVVPQDQVPHSTIPGQIGTSLIGGSVVPSPQASALHFAGRAIGSPLPPYYHPYYGKTYASPYYNQYQPSPYQAFYPHPQSFYPYQYPAASAYSVGLPYSSAPAAAPASANQYSGNLYSSPITPYSAYPYNYPTGAAAAPAASPAAAAYVPQYYSAYPSSPSYYQSASGEIQTLSKQ